MEPVLYRYLAWDSEFFGMGIARLAASRLSPDMIEGVEAWCVAKKISCLYFLADASDPRTVSLAEDHGFRLMDVRVTLAATLSLPCPPGEQADTPMVRLARASDIQALRALARVSHRESRFYADPKFPDRLCDRLYEDWIEKSCSGWADAVFVADLGAGAVGYATAHRDGPGVGSLGLIAVDPASQGRGLGRKLATAVLDWGRQGGLSLVRVVTQGRNIRAQRLYGGCGFQMDSLQLWYHRWFVDPTRGT